VIVPLSGSTELEPGLPLGLQGSGEKKKNMVNDFKFLKAIFANEI